MLKDEIMAFNHYYRQGTETEGRRSTLYYSTKWITFTSLLYYNYSSSN
jgi:hypothetical protein